MNAEELPAVVSGISNEIGTTESESYNQSVGDALMTLQQALSAAKTGLTSSLGQITGETSAETPDAFDAETPAEEPVDVDVDTSIDVSEPDDMALPEPEDETDIGTAGRELR